MPPWRLQWMQSSKLSSREHPAQTPTLLLSKLCRCAVRITARGISAMALCSFQQGWAACPQSAQGCCCSSTCGVSAHDRTTTVSSCLTMLVSSCGAELYAAQLEIVSAIFRTRVKST